MGRCEQCGWPSPPLVEGGPTPRFCSATCRATYDLVTFARNACERAGTTDIYIEALDVEVDAEKVYENREHLDRMARARRARRAS
jgi:hypothetical protein